LWDIHEVLLEPQDRLISFFSFPHLKEILSHASWPFIKNLTKLLSKNLFNETSSEEYITLGLQHNNPHFAELAIAIANSYRPIPGMRELIRELHELGIEQHIGSNIGQAAFHRLLNAQKYPYIAPLFKYMNLNKSIVVKSENGDIIKKPDVRFYERYLQKNNIDLEQTPVIFIDDKWDNVRVARSMGFDAILFKNPHQLRIALRKHLIPIHAPKFNYSSQRDQHFLRPLYRLLPYHKATNATR
jgi:FMN phosphatase YigB (HAD superfamily)